MDKSCDVGEYLDYANCKHKNVMEMLMEMKWFIMQLCFIMEEYANLVRCI